MAEVKVNRNIPQSAFKSQSTITSVHFGSKCSSVGQDAFNGCTSLSEINDDNAIEEIYGGAFANTKLSSVTFRKLKYIDSFGSGAFENCSYLTNINIQNCKSIPENTFYGCDNLTDINIQSCTTIGLSAFYNCENLKNVKLKLNGNTISIDPTAFYNCKNLKNIDFRNCLRIGNNAFAYCTSIENANLNKCIGIGDSAFAVCTNLKKINLSSCSIGDSAFFGCINLSEVYINTTPSNRISLGSYVFYYKNNNSEGGPSWGKNGLLPQESTYSIISNIRFYLGVDIFNSYYTDPNWSVYKDYMFKLPGDNQILYTTENNEQIDIDNSKYGGILSHEYVNNIGSIEFNESIDTLNQKIFINNTKITSICLPSECKEVGESEFEGCTSLDSFIPSPLNVLKKIGNCAFKDCTSLKSFMIPESITTLGEGIFAGCKNIEKFEGKFVTYNNKAIVCDVYDEYDNAYKTLISVAPKDNSESGGRYYKITDIDLDISKLGKYCFSGNVELRRVDIPSNITSIGDYAFEGCEKLREVHFYGGYPNLDIFKNNPFGFIQKDENGNYVAKSDFKIFVPESNIKDMLNAINETNNNFLKLHMDYIYPEPAKNYIIYYSEKRILEKDIEVKTIKQTYFKRSIKNTLENFKNKDISKIIIGENITIIGDEAFKNCKNLEYVYLPDTIEKIGNECFYNCKSLKRINIPNIPVGNDVVEIQQNQTKEINENQFVNSSQYLFPTKGRTSFGNDIFYGCTELTEFDSYYKDFVSEDNRCYIDGGKLMFFAQGHSSSSESEKPENYTIKIEEINTINNCAFKGCTSISKITFPENLTTIGESAFEGCTKLSSINNLTNVKIISKSAFKGCTSISKITFPENLTTIGESAFEGCENMYFATETELTINKEIGSKTFQNCYKFNCSKLILNVNYINDSAFYMCGKDAETGFEVILGENVTKIGKYAFSNSALSGELSIPNSVEYIESNCFSKSNIESFKILSSNSKLKEIKEYSFDGCKLLKTVNISKANMLNTISYSTFKNCTELNNVILNDCITRIRYDAFLNCQKIEEIYLPSKLLELEDDCFNTGYFYDMENGIPETNIPKIYVHKDTKTPPIFIYTNGREDVKGNINPFGEPSIENNGTKKISPQIYVPSGYKSIYTENKHWGRYKNHINTYTNDSGFPDAGFG